MNKNEIIVWFDLDGTLFDFNYDGNYRIPGYYENLAERRSICEAADRINGMTLNGTILKAYTLSSYLEDLIYDPVREKNIALDRETNIPYCQRFYIPCGQSKWKKVCELGLQNRSILVDDYGINIKDWKGPYVKVSKDSEDMKKEVLKHSLCISPESSTEECLNTICYAAENLLIGSI